MILYALYINIEMQIRILFLCRLLMFHSSTTVNVNVGIETKALML